MAPQEVDPKGFDEPVRLYEVRFETCHPLLLEFAERQVSAPDLFGEDPDRVTEQLGAEFVGRIQACTGNGNSSRKDPPDNSST